MKDKNTIYMIYEALLELDKIDTSITWQYSVKSYLNKKASRVNKQETKSRIIFVI